MKTVLYLTRRNSKMFFKDKGLFFTSLITPLILLVLYITFLGNVYYTSFDANLPAELGIDRNVIDGCVGGQLLSSLLSVSCVTVAFCSNMLMVQDKVTGATKDIGMTPLKPSTLAMSYYVSTFASTLIICTVATAACFVYLGVVGWYLSIADIFAVVLDVILLVMFGTALSSIINFFLSTQGQISAVGTVVSAGYGFICGAYMPISQFSEGLQKAIAFLPGTYGTSLLRNHTMGGALNAMKDEGVPVEIIDVIKDTVDCNLYFFDSRVPMGAMYAVLAGSAVALVGIYVLINCTLGKRINKR